MPVPAKPSAGEAGTVAGPTPVPAVTPPAWAQLAALGVGVLAAWVGTCIEKQEAEKKQLTKEALEMPLAPNLQNQILDAQRQADEKSVRQLLEEFIQKQEAEKKQVTMEAPEITLSRSCRTSH